MKLITMTAPPDGERPHCTTPPDMVNYPRFRYQPNGKSSTRTANPKQSALDVIGLSFADMLDPITPGVLHGSQAP